MAGTRKGAWDEWVKFFCAASQNSRGRYQVRVSCSTSGTATAATAIVGRFGVTIRFLD